MTFVVERKKLNSFRFSMVVGEGLLKPFGWYKFTEADQGKIVGIKAV